MFLLFIVLPITEIIVLIEVGSQIGALMTAGLVVLTAVIGSAILYQQGLDTLLRANTKLRSGNLPVSEMAEGICLAIAGAFLVTPGFVTDVIGFSLLIPTVRGWLIKALSARISVSATTSSAGAGYSEKVESVIIEGEFHRESGVKTDSTIKKV